MGDVKDNWTTGEHVQFTSGAAVHLGWGVAVGRQSPAAHDWSQPDLTRADLDDLITSAKNNTLSNFSTDAAAAWGSWWSGLSSGDRERVYKALKASQL